MGNIDSSEWFKNPSLTDDSDLSEDEDNAMNNFNLESRRRQNRDAENTNLATYKDRKKERVIQNEKNIAIIEDLEQNLGHKDLEQDLGHNDKDREQFYMPTSKNVTPSEPFQRGSVHRPPWLTETEDEVSYPNAKISNNDPQKADEKSIKSDENGNTIAALSVSKAAHLKTAGEPVKQNKDDGEILEQRLRAKFSEWIWNGRLDDLSDCRNILFGDSYI